MQAVLVEQPYVPQTRVAEPPPPPEVPPQVEPPEEMVVPEAITEPPKIALPKQPEKPKPAQKPAEKPQEVRKPLLKQPLLSADKLDAEMESVQRELRKAEMMRQMEQEMSRSASAVKVSANAAIIDQYRGLITQRVENKWTRPLSARAGMTVTLRISMLPGGEVANVVPTVSSGDTAFDMSAVDAVRSASPLPVPTDVAVFNQSFRNFIIKFSPKDL